MAKIRTSLPASSGCGGTVAMIFLACVLVAANSALAFSLLQLVKEFIPAEILEPRWEQVLLFLIPVVGLTLELWGLSALVRFLLPQRSSGSENITLSSGHPERAVQARAAAKWR